MNIKEKNHLKQKNLTNLPFRKKKNLKRIFNNIVCWNADWLDFDC